MAETSFMDKLVAACGEMRNPPLDSRNPHFKNKFASLLAVANVVRPALAKHGLAFRQSVDILDGITCVVTYAFGTDKDNGPMEKAMATVPIRVVDNPQQMGSALTYAKRYCLLAAFGLVGDEDDDGEAASKAAPKTQKAPQKVLTDAEKAELAEIAKALGGDKRPVFAAWKANGIEGARALLAAKPTQVELFDDDQSF